jgi:hypothetical protein
MVSGFANQFAWPDTIFVFHEMFTGGVLAATDAEVVALQQLIRSSKYVGV